MQLLLHKQYSKHIILCLPHLQLPHLVPSDLHLHVEVTWVMEIFGNDNGLVHCIRISSLSGSCFQPQSNFEGGNLFDSLFLQTHPAWKALLLICSFRPSLDGGSFLRLSLAEWTYSWYLASFTRIFDSLLTYKVATYRSKASIVAVSVSQLGSWSAIEVCMLFHQLYLTPGPASDWRKILSIFQKTMK